MCVCVCVCVCVCIHGEEAGWGCPLDSLKDLGAEDPGQTAALAQSTPFSRDGPSWRGQWKSSAIICLSLSYMTCGC